MKAKDTIMSPQEIDAAKKEATFAKYYWNEFGVTTAESMIARQQAEISFGAGEQESDKKWRQILRDSVAMSKLTGIKEVVEFVGREIFTMLNMSSVSVQFKDKWNDKLKEWGV